QAFALRAEQEGDAAGEIERREGLTAVRLERDARSTGVGPGSDGDAPDRAGARTQRLRRRRVGAPVRQNDRSTECVRRADERSDVARIGEVPERERRLALLPRRQVLAAVDTDDARRMRRARDLGEELRLHVLAGAQQVDGLGARRVDRILTLDEEEPELVAPALVVQLSHELQALVVLRADHRPQSSQAPWKSNTSSRSVRPSG